MARTRKTHWPVALIAMLCALCLACEASAATMAYGDISDDVRTLQNTLQDRGYFDERVDGVFGPETLVAICKFQSATGLQVDGIPGKKTLAKLYQKKAKPVAKKAPAQPKPDDRGSLRYGSYGKRVKTLQRALRDYGYYVGSIDGCFGIRTREAVEQYQWENRLYVDGVAGGETWTSLFGSVGASSAGSSCFSNDIPLPVEEPWVNPDDWLWIVDEPIAPEIETFFPYVG